MNMTEHARIRSQQRAIPPILIDLLMKFGAREAVGKGATKMYFNKAARKRIKVYAGPLAGLLNEHLDVYAVVSAENEIITTAHLTERINRH
jgi:hypothetical protein